MDGQVHHDQHDVDIEYDEQSVLEWPYYEKEELDLYDMLILFSRFTV